METYVGVEDDVNDELLKQPLAKNRSVGPRVLQWGPIRMAATTANVLFAVAAVVGQVGVNVSLPLFSNAVGNTGPYFVLLYGSFWFALLFMLWLAALKVFTNDIRPETTNYSHLQMFYIGACTALNGLLVVYASPTNRTPAFLQALLANVSIPMTIGFRRLVLRKSISWLQWLCALVVVIALFIALVPTIFNLDPQGSQTSAGSGLRAILWPICFMTGFAPASLFNVLQEKGLKRSTSIERSTSGARTSSTGSYASVPAGDESSVNLIYLLGWSNVYQFLVNIGLFWTNLIPHFGMADNMKDMMSSMWAGLQCALWESNCTASGVLTSAAVFIFMFMLSFLAGGLLIRHSEGANMLALVNTLTTPIATLWWCLFTPVPFSWYPEFASTTWYAVGGLALMVPAIIYYNKLSKPAH